MAGCAASFVTTVPALYNLTLAQAPRTNRGRSEGEIIPFLEGAAQKVKQGGQGRTRSLAAPANVPILAHSG